MLVFGCAFTSSLFDQDDVCLYVKPKPETYLRADGKRFWVEHKSLPNYETGNEIMIIGDSHSRHFVPILLSNDGVSIVHQMAISMGDPERERSLAKRFLNDENGFDKFSPPKIGRNISFINQLYIAYRFLNKTSEAKSIFIQYMDRLTTYFADGRLKVTIFRDIPSYRLDPLRCLNISRKSFWNKGCGVDFKGTIPKKYILNINEPYWKSLNEKYSNIPFVNLIDTHLGLCTQKGCKTFVAGKFIYRDTNHLNERLPDDINSKLRELFLNIKMQNVTSSHIAE